MLLPIKQLIISSRSISALAKTMKTFSVVPDIIPVAPDETAKILYPSGVNVELGNEITPTQAKDAPEIKWKTENIEDHFTLCMIDPDAPSRKDPKNREWHHWLVGNIPENCNLDKGDTLSEYIGPGPPNETGFHRYIFLIYKQPKKIEFDEPRLNTSSAKNRSHFSIIKFADKYKLGTPVAGNMFQAKWDEYVPELYIQLGIID